MRKILAWLVFVPLAIVFVLFAVANRTIVTVSLDPFSSTAPAFALTAPLFIVILVTLVVGVLLGGIVVWFGKLRWQFAAHRAEREATRLRAEKAEAELRARDAAYDGGRSLPPPDDRAAAE
jgi:uncharacterized integral membrane protein